MALDATRESAKVGSHFRRDSLECRGAPQESGSCQGLRSDTVSGGAPVEPTFKFNDLVAAASNEQSRLVHRLVARLT